MKNLKILLVLVIMSSLIFSCKKGDQGVPGIDGANGINGTNGDDGNANVISYVFGPKTFSGTVDYTLENMSREKMDSSLILVFYNPSGEAETAWYPIPGGGSGNAYQARYFVYQKLAPFDTDYSLGVRLNKPDGTPYTNAVTFTKLKVIIAPASTIVSSAAELSPDLLDYNIVKQRYNLKD